LYINLRFLTTLFLNLIFSFILRMKRFFIFGLISLAVAWMNPSTAFADTSVSGNITSPVTWTAGNSPYIVTGNITVAETATLTVQNGAVVKFAANTGITVLGGMIATGVEFTSNAATPAKGDWYSIVAGAANDPGAVTLTDCEVKYGGRSDGAIRLIRGMITLVNTSVSYSPSTAVYVNDIATGNDEWLDITGGVFDGTSAALQVVAGKVTAENAAFTATTNGVSITGGTVNLTGGSITAAAVGLYAYGGTATISGTNIQATAGNGIHLANAAANVSLGASNVTASGVPVRYSAGAAFTCPEANTFSAGSNYVQVEVASFAKTLTFPSLPIPYVLPNSFTVAAGGKLIVGSGNILKSGNWITVRGTLEAVAEPGETILFTSATDDNAGGSTNNSTPDVPKVQDWGGIEFSAGSDASVLKNCEIRYGGKGNFGAVYFNNASPRVESCTLSNNCYGFDLRNASNPVLVKNTIASSSITPVVMSFDSNPVFTDNVFSSSDNTYDAIGLWGGELAADAHIVKRNFTTIQNVSYVMLGELFVPNGRKLTIDPGIVIKMTNYTHAFRIAGTLSAVGTATEKVVFTSIHDDTHGNPLDCNKNGNTTNPATGNWAGIIFEANSDDNNCKLEHCVVKYASMNSRRYNDQNIGGGAITMIDASPVIRNVDIQHTNYGTYAFRGSNPVIENVDIQNTGTSTPIAQSFTANPVYTSVSFTNPGLAALGIIGEAIGVSGHLAQKTVAGFENITYVLLDDVTITSGTQVTVDPGVVVKALSGSVDIFCEGGLKIAGTEAAPVIFTSIADDNYGNPSDTQRNGNATSPAKGNWGSIVYRSTTDDAFSTVNYAKILYGGTFAINSNPASLWFSNASNTVSNTLVSDASGYGIGLEGDAAPNLTGNITIQNCGLEPIGFYLTANPVTNLSSPVFIGNGTNGLRIFNQTITTNVTLAKRNASGIVNVAYVLEDMTVGANTVFTINPGIVLKFKERWIYTNNNIYVYGALKAVGTQEEPVYFTSIADDSKGGDTNGDGNASVPGVTWGGVRFLESGISAQNVMKNCVLAYGAYDYYLQSRGVIDIRNSYADIDACVIENVHFGVGITGSANPHIRNCQISNVTYTPVLMSLFAAPVFSDNHFANAGYAAIGIFPETYSVDATVPVRNFGGYDNITYLLFSSPSDGVNRINSGTHITVPEGIVFKSYSNSSNVNYPMLFIDGKLTVNGNAEKPVVFADADNDDYGNPRDTRSNGYTLPANSGGAYGLVFSDISDDASSISHAVFASLSRGVHLNQASPTISNSRFENSYTGIYLSGVSEPRINNCVFHNLYRTPTYQSLASQIVTGDTPASSSNVLSGSTWKALGVISETLVQYATLDQKTFAGIQNIPYYFSGNYTVGTSAILTMKPGIVCKFDERVRLFVQRGLMAQGGAAQNQKIVFTSIYDDFYGGDTDASGQQSSGYTGWGGLVYEATSLPADCILDNCIIRQARPWLGSFYGTAITTNIASPTVTNTTIYDCYHGFVLNGASNPVINNCDIYRIDPSGYAINNVNRSFTVDATNNWWGNDSGPSHESNPGGTGGKISDAVSYSPFKTHGSNVPVLGDVSLNGLIQAYDASLVLQSVVGSLNLSVAQQAVADVSGDGTIGAFDASHILQYVAGTSYTFPAQLRSSAVPALEAGEITGEGARITLPVRLAGPTDVYSIEWTAFYDTQQLKAVAVTGNETSGALFASRIDEADGKIQIALAGAERQADGSVIAFITFEMLAGEENLHLSTGSFSINETDCTENTGDWEIPIFRTPTGINGLPANASMFSISSGGEIRYTVSESNTPVQITVYDLSGRLIAQPVNGLHETGTYTATAGKACKGAYIVKMTADGQSEIKKAVIR
jgi:parallel beta-helix repeat protein